MKAKERREMDRLLFEKESRPPEYDAYLEHEYKHAEKREELRRRRVRRDKDAE